MEMEEDGAWSVEKGETDATHQFEEEIGSDSARAIKQRVEV